jgi:hypothetical protein
MKYENLDVKKPILVTGSHRSGSTFVGKVISSSPLVGYIHEPFNYYLNRKGICDADFDKFFTYITQENEDLYFKSIKKTIDFNYDLFSQLRLVKSFTDLRYLLSEYSHFTQSRVRGLRPLLKDPFALFSSRWLAEKFDMSIVILIRHPAAFASSLMALNWSFPFSHFLEQPLLMNDYLYPYEVNILEYSRVKKSVLDQAILLWKLIHHFILQLKSSNSDYLFMRHEDISMEPIKSFNFMFDHLSLDFSEHTVRMIGQSCDVSLGLNDQITDPYSIRRNSKNLQKKWKKMLMPEEVTYIRNSVEEVSHFFYEDEDW